VEEIRHEADQTYTKGLAVMAKTQSTAIIKIYEAEAHLKPRFMQVPKAGGISMYVNVVNRKGRTVRQFPMFDGNTIILKK
jgi:DNA integrity scanning protein DisA with diadenylate cyclase activity